MALVAPPTERLETAPVIDIPDLTLHDVVKAAGEPATEAFNFSNTLWKLNGDLLPEGYGVIAQLGRTAEGQLVSLDGRETTPVYNNSLFFDARKSSEHEYAWQLSVARQNGGRVLQLFTSPESSYIKGAEYDEQYRFSPTKISVLPSDIDALTDVIKEIANHRLTKGNFERIRARQAIANTALSNLQIFGKTAKDEPKLEGDFYDKKFKQLEEQSVRGLASLSLRQL